MTDNTAERIQAVEKTLKFEFHDKQLLLKALETAGGAEESQGHTTLSILGANVVNLILSERRFERNLPTDERITARESLGDQVLLAQIGFQLGLDAYIQGNPALEGVDLNKAMATTVKAIIGAAYRDSNSDSTVMHALLLHMGILDL